MKITEEGLNSYMMKGAITFDSHERVPFFVCTKDSTITINEEELNVMENFYTETHQGITYVKMDSTGKAFGKLNGAEPTYSASYTPERQLVWVEQLGTAISANMMQEIRRVSNLLETIEGAKEVALEQINEYFDNLALQGFESDCLGEVKRFDTDPKSVSQIMGQVLTATQNQVKKLIDPGADTVKVSWKESGVTLCYDWTDEQMLKLGEDLQKATTMLEHKREELIATIENCTEVEQVTDVLSQL